MTVVHINQPRFLPALNYFQRMLIADVFVYLDTVQFQRHDWENRNKIKALNKAGWSWLSVPVIAPKGTRITEAIIDDSTDWRTKMCKTVQMNYARAYKFKDYYPQFESIIQMRVKEQPLVMLNYALIEMFREAWNLNRCRYVYASDLGCRGTKENLLLDICKKLDARVYLSGLEGRNYNTPERWENAGIRLAYHDYKYPRYKQVHAPNRGAFQAWMSALDLLLNCGKDGREVLDVGLFEHHTAVRIYT